MSSRTGPSCYRAPHPAGEVPGGQKPRQLRFPGNSIVQQDAGAGTGPLRVSGKKRKSFAVGQQRHRKDAHQGRRDKISVISGISLNPRRFRLSLYYLLFFDNIGQQEVCRFLRELLRHLRGPIIALLDNPFTHKGDPIEQLQRRQHRLQVEYFPSYAPELNPDERVWSLAKRDLANSCSRDVDELMEDILRSIDGIRSSPQKLRGCIPQSELPSFALNHYINYAAVNSGGNGRISLTPSVRVPALRKSASAIVGMAKP